MNFYNPKVLTATNVDYRLLDKPVLQSLSEIMSDILSKYDCTSAVVREFCINGDKEDISLFDQCYDNAAIYDTISLYASGRSADRTKHLDIMVAVNFTLPEPRCHIALAGDGIADAQQTDIFEAIVNFIYEAVKVESPEPQCEKHTNTPTVDTEQKAVKKKIKINWRIVVDVFIALAGIAAAIITLIAAKG